jgi:hypothetical protein
MAGHSPDSVGVSATMPETKVLLCNVMEVANQHSK